MRGSTTARLLPACLNNRGPQATKADSGGPSKSNRAGSASLTPVFQAGACLICRGSLVFRKADLIANTREQDAAEVPLCAVTLQFRQGCIAVGSLTWRFPARRSGAGAGNRTINWHARTPVCCDGRAAGLTRLMCICESTKACQPA